MITENELMIGNILLVDKQKTVRVLWFKHDRVCIMKVGETYPSAIVHISRLEPVQLNEEWLNRCGLTKVDYGYKTDELRKTPRWIKREFGTKKMLESPFLRFDSLVDVFYVHQLQNVIFALTNKRIILN